jgi:hypothetical protein
MLWLRHALNEPCVRSAGADSGNKDTVSASTVTGGALFESPRVALLCDVLRRLVGPVGIFLTVIVVIQFGNPSSGGANGVPYLPDFWRDLGPFLPPRNAYLLLRDTVYCDGHGIGQALTVLLAYTVIAGVLLIILDWFVDRRPLSVAGIEDSHTEAVMAPVVIARGVGQPT